ncbi:MAG: SufS family cysteine desulfurase [Finegoldia sp.]|nr:SufS family cysteine desulfurase [Finegoldia sp.]
MLDRQEINEIRKDFPYLDKTYNGNHIVYFDNAATSQKPKQVIDSVASYYSYENANPHRGAHTLSNIATEVYESARSKVADFINADSADQIVFTRNTTEAMNLITYSYGLNNLSESDEILISIMEHHSSCVNWQFASQKTGAKLKYLYIDKESKQIDFEEFKSKVSAKTKIFSITQASNVVGTMPDVKKMIAYIREVSPDCICIVDSAQYAPHNKVDVKDLDCDFLAFSGHKMLAFNSSGVLYGKKEILNSMAPFLYGGDMIEYVTEEKSSFLDAPGRFEAGTQDVGGVRSLSAAIDYIEKIGIDKIKEYEKYLTDYAYQKMLEKTDIIDIYTTPEENRSALIDFNFKEVHPHDVATILDASGIAIRSGHHCAQPLHRFLGSNFSCRASFAFYNTIEEVDYFIEHLDDVGRLMRIGSK